MARRRTTKKRKSGKRKIPLGVTMGLVGTFYPAIASAMAGNPQQALAQATKSVTGFDPASGKFDLGALIAGLMPLFAGTGVSIAAGALGINRRLKLPLVKI